MKTEFQRTFVALVGALVLSSACIGAAVGPARAAELSKPGMHATTVTGQVRI